MTPSRSTCLSPFCGHRVADRVARCPACGRQMFDDVEIARRGRHVLQLGLILAGLMVAVLWLWPGPLAAIAETPQTSFRGTTGQAWGIVLGLGSIGLTGVAFVLSSTLMIQGRPSRAATIAAIGLFVAGLTCLGAALVSAYAG